jgi:hypothetical protein
MFRKGSFLCRLPQTVTVIDSRDGSERQVIRLQWQVIHEDIIGDTFWQRNSHLLKGSLDEGSSSSSTMADESNIQKKKKKNQHKKNDIVEAMEPSAEEQRTKTESSKEEATISSSPKEQ